MECARGIFRAAVQYQIVQENYGCFDGSQSPENTVAHSQTFQGLFFSLNFQPETSRVSPASGKTVNASRERGKSVRNQHSQEMRIAFQQWGESLIARAPGPTSMAQP